MIAALGVAICAGLVALAEQAPTSPAAQSIAHVLPLATPRLIEAQAITTDPARRRELPVALADTHEAMALAPDRLRAVLVRLDAVTLAHKGALSPEGIALLDRSYRLSPLDLTYSIGRLTFAYNHWDALTPGLREHAFAETVCLRTVHTAALDAIPLRATNRIGGLAAAMNLRRSWHTPTKCHPNL